MDVFKIDEKGLLYIAPDIDNWDPLEKMDIHVIFDLDDDLDIGVPEIPDQLLYIYFPFEDKELPDLAKLHENAKLGASMINQGYRVLCHCGMGHNRLAGRFNPDLFGDVRGRSYYPNTQSTYGAALQQEVRSIFAGLAESKKKRECA